MFLNINELKIHYNVSGKGKNVVLLHGWGAQLESFASVHTYLENYFQTYSLDLPGFGHSDVPKAPWGSQEYADVIQQFLHILNIDHPILIGHSFGGRIIIRLATTAQVNKIILVDSAGIRPKRKMLYYLKIYTYKLIKKLAMLPILSRDDSIVEQLRKRFGSRDYQHASGVMKGTLIKVVNEDLRNFLPNIKAPTLLIWGENDHVTPVSDGKLMERLIPDAGLVILKDAGHFSYLDKFQEFILIISNFLKEDMKNLHIP